MLAAATGGFAVYSLLRVAVSLSPLAGTSLDRMLFSVEATGVVATASVLLTGLAVVLVRRSPALGGPDRSTAWTRVAFDDWSRARADLGVDGLLALLTELRMAAREVDPSAVDVYRGVEVRRPSALPAVRSRLRDGYGWRAAQLSLLTESADATPRIVSRQPRIAAAIAVMSAGVDRQHPPTRRAPASTHDGASSASGAAPPCHVRVAASHVSPVLG
ncbi:hypothetical protein HR12_24125 [Microbacterium sp. SUBG005]|nr:hypothetical protein HR12_24125 [Microbacterium sp. SUBG005]